MTRTSTGRVGRWIERRLAEVDHTKHSSRDLKRLSLRVDAGALKQLEALAKTCELPPATLASSLLLEALEEALEQVNNRVAKVNFKDSPRASSEVV